MWLASKALGLTVDKPFEFWKGKIQCHKMWRLTLSAAASNGQVGGYRTVYKEMTFATVRGAGHMVSE